MTQSKVQHNRLVTLRQYEQAKKTAEYFRQCAVFVRAIADYTEEEKQKLAEIDERLQERTKAIH